MQNAERRMKNPLARTLLFFILHSAFCVLHSSASDFKLATPGYDFSFPRDHGSPPSYRMDVV